MPAPELSIVIPVYNEEGTIGSLLHSLETLAGVEVILVDGGSQDHTVALALASGRVRILETAAGRAAQMNAGAKVSAGRVLFFLHADARLAPGFPDRIRRALDDPAVMGGNFDIQYEGDDWAARCFTRVNRWRRKCRIFYGDSGIFCRREVFESLGGYQPWPIMEDYDFARRLSKCGKLALLEEPIWVSDRRWRKAGLLRTLWSWFVIQGLYSLGIPPHRLARLYRHVR
jgi:rSAM/selenodomain-associated transferase 2